MASFFQSSIGKKAIMAITGILLFLFIIGHLLGNLQIFLGQDAFNSYAEFLRSLGPFLWATRIGLLVVFLLHVVTALQLRQANSSARPIAYNKKETVTATLTSRSMYLTGLLILFFVIFHLLHLTFGVVHPEFANLHDAQGRHDVYSMVIHGFRDPAISSTYIMMMVLLGMHLSHGLQSFFQTMGVCHPKVVSSVRSLSPAVAGIIAIAYISIPFSIILGLLQVTK